jgi:hypothetical protein
MDYGGGIYLGFNAVVIFLYKRRKEGVKSSK